MKFGSRLTKRFLNGKFSRYFNDLLESAGTVAVTSSKATLQPITALATATVPRIPHFH